MDTRLASLLVIVSIAVLALGALLVPVVIARLPADYFVREDQPGAATSGRWSDRGSRRHPIVFWLSNIAGMVLVIAGIVMLVLPGQGVLTILAGLSLLSFPGKRRLQLRLLRMSAIRRAIAALRKRAGKPPLGLEP